MLFAPARRFARSCLPRAAVTARAYHPAEPEMEHSIVTLDPARRAPRNPPALFPQPSHLVNEAAARNRDTPTPETARELKDAMAADDAIWAAYLADNWPTLAEKKKAVHAAKGSADSIDAFNAELEKVMQATGYVQNQGGEWVSDTSAPNHALNASGGLARWSAAAAGVQMSGAKGLETHADRVAYRNLNARRLAKHGGKAGKAGAKKAKAIAVAGDDIDWETTDVAFEAVADHLGGCAPLFVDDARVVVPGDFSVRVVTNDASAMLMAHTVLEAFPASKQGDNFLNGSKAINVFLSPDMKVPKGTAAAVVGVEDDGTSRVALAGAAVSEATLRAALAISREALMPAAEEA